MKRLLSPLVIFFAFFIVGYCQAQQLDLKDDVYLNQKTIVRNQVNEPIGYYSTSQNQFVVDLYTLDGVFIESISVGENVDLELTQMEDRLKENKSQMLKPSSPVQKFKTNRNRTIL